MGTATYDFGAETVVVTGGASGIGRAVALAFGDAGATVLVADVRETPSDAGETVPTHERIETAGGSAAFVETDVRDPDDVGAVVEAARAFGGLDVMVNNAGIYRGDHIADADPEDLDAMLSVNVRGVFLGCRAAARESAGATGRRAVSSTRRRSAPPGVSTPTPATTPPRAP